jgi:hypothetical protein
MHSQGRSQDLAIEGLAPLLPPQIPMRGLGKLSGAHGGRGSSSPLRLTDYLRDYA